MTMQLQSTLLLVKNAFKGVSSMIVCRWVWEHELHELIARLTVLIAVPSFVYPTTISFRNYHEGCSLTSLLFSAWWSLNSPPVTDNGQEARCCTQSRPRGLITAPFPLIYPLSSYLLDTLKSQDWKVFWCKSLIMCLCNIYKNYSLVTWSLKKNSSTVL